MTGQVANWSQKVAARGENTHKPLEAAMGKYFIKCLLCLALRKPDIGVSPKSQKEYWVSWDALKDLQKSRRLCKFLTSLPKTKKIINFFS